MLVFYFYLKERGNYKSREILKFHPFLLLAFFLSLSLYLSLNLFPHLISTFFHPILTLYKCWCSFVLPFQSFAFKGIVSLVIFIDKHAQSQLCKTDLNLFPVCKIKDIGKVFVILSPKKMHWLLAMGIGKRKFLVIFIRWGIGQYTVKSPRYKLFSDSLA